MATESDKVNVAALGTIVIVGALAMVGIASAVTALVRSETDELSAKVGANANLDGITSARAEQRQKLEAPVSWADKASGKIHIPIDRAMQVVVANLERNPESATPPPPVPASASAAASSSAAQGAPPPEGSVTEGANSAASAASPAPNGSAPTKTREPTPAKMHAPDSPKPQGGATKAPMPAASAPAHALPKNAP